MSSPGAYSRCCANSTDWPKYGLRCRPDRKPSTTLRARISSRAIRATASGGKNLREVWVTGQLAFLRGSRFNQLLDDMVRRDPFALGREIDHDPVPQNRSGQR